MMPSDPDHNKESACVNFNDFDILIERMFPKYQSSPMSMGGGKGEFRVLLVI